MQITPQQDRALDRMNACEKLLQDCQELAPMLGEIFQLYEVDGSNMNEGEINAHLAQISASKASLTVKTQAVFDEFQSNNPVDDKWEQMILSIGTRLAKFSDHDEEDSELRAKSLVETMDLANLYADQQIPILGLEDIEPEVQV